MKRAGEGRGGDGLGDCCIRVLVWPFGWEEAVLSYACVVVGSFLLLYPSRAGIFCIRYAVLFFPLSLSLSCLFSLSDGALREPINSVSMDGWMLDGLEYTSLSFFSPFSILSLYNGWRFSF